MRITEENVVHAEERFGISHTPPIDSETQRKESLGFSFAIGKRPNLPNQTNGNVVDMTDYQHFSPPAHRIGQATLGIVDLPTRHDNIELKRPLAAVLAPIKADIARLRISFPREAELMFIQLIERAKTGDSSQQLLTQFVFYTYGMQQSQELHTPDLHPYLRAVPDINK